MNPAITGAVTVTSSSPTPWGVQDPKHLTSRRFHPSLRAEARASGPGGAALAFWAVDLGAECRVACCRYTLRQNSSLDCLRDWLFQVLLSGQVIVFRH